MGALRRTRGRFALPFHFLSLTPAPSRPCDLPFFLSPALPSFIFVLPSILSLPLPHHPHRPSSAICKASLFRRRHHDSPSPTLVSRTPSHCTLPPPRPSVLSFPPPLSGARANSSPAAPLPCARLRPCRSGRGRHLLLDHAVAALMSPLWCSRWPLLHTHAVIHMHDYKMHTCTVTYTLQYSAFHACALCVRRLHIYIITVCLKKLHIRVCLFIGMCYYLFANIILIVITV